MFTNGLIIIVHFLTLCTTTLGVYYAIRTELKKNGKQSLEAKLVEEKRHASHEQRLALLEERIALMEATINSRLEEISRRISQLITKIYKRK